MSLRKVLPRLRLSRSYAVLVICVLSIAAAQAVYAQNSSDFQFASSSQGLVADFNPSEALAFPSTAAGAEQSRGSYGYHDKGIASRLTFEGGGGFNAPIGNDQPFITWGGNFTVGGGLRFDRHFSLLAEYQFMDNKLPGSLIADAGAQGGHAHIWSLTLDPVIDLFPARRNDVYFTGGGGFYRKVTSFTDPVQVEECYYFCYVGTENVVVSHFSSNQGGANIGIGFTHKLGSDDRMKAFAEARYLWIDTPPVGEQDGLGKTELLPVTFGIRW